MTDVEIAWVAGLFEGEGTFSFGKKVGNGNFVGISLGITSTDKDVLEKFLKLAGVGKIYKKKKRMPHHKDQWFWNVARKSEVKSLIEAMIPHLGERRTIRAYEALQHCDYLGPSQGPTLLLEPRFCSVEDCGDKHKAHGLCKYHYQRQRLNRVRINKRPTKAAG